MKTKGEKQRKKWVPGNRITLCVIAAKNKGHLKAVKPIIDKIQKTNFRISKELIDRVLEKVNES